jgi:hypothetical protein
MSEALVSTLLLGLILAVVAFGVGWTVCAIFIDRNPRMEG